MKRKHIKIMMAIAAAACILWLAVPFEVGFASAPIFEWLTDEYVCSALFYGMGMYSLAEAPMLGSLLFFFLPVIVCAASAVCVLTGKDIRMLKGGAIGGIASSAVLIIESMIILSEISFSFLGPCICLIGSAVMIAASVMLIMDMGKQKKTPRKAAPAAAPVQPAAKHSGKGEAECISGEFAGGVFEVSPRIVIGKDSAACNVILQNRTISKVHCMVLHNGDGTYSVADVSTNGTYLGDGSRLLRNMDTKLPAGTTISMGSPAEVFLLR